MERSVDGGRGRSWWESEGRSSLEIPLRDDHHPRQLQLDQVSCVLKKGNCFFQCSSANARSVDFDQLVAKLDCLGTLGQTTLSHAGEEQIIHFTNFKCYEIKAMNLEITIGPTFEPFESPSSVARVMPIGPPVRSSSTWSKCF